MKYKLIVPRWHHMAPQTSVDTVSGLLPDNVKPLPVPMLTLCYMIIQEKNSMTLESKCNHFYSTTCKCCVQNCGYFVLNPHQFWFRQWLGIKEETMNDQTKYEKDLWLVTMILHCIIQELQACDDVHLIVVWHWQLTPKWLGHIFKNVILFRSVVHHKCDIFIWNWSNTINV